MIPGSPGEGILNLLRFSLPVYFLKTIFLGYKRIFHMIHFRHEHLKRPAIGLEVAIKGAVDTKLFSRLGMRHGTFNDPVSFVLEMKPRFPGLR